MQLIVVWKEAILSSLILLSDHIHLHKQYHF